MTARYHVNTTYDGPAYSALTDVTWELYNGRNYRKFLTPCLLILAAVGALVLTLAKLGSFPLWFAILAVIMLLASPAAMGAQKKRLTQQSVEKAPMYPMEVSFDFADHAFTVRDPFGEKRVEYSTVERIVDGGSYLFLLWGQSAYLLQTKHNFSTPEERKEFCLYLHQKCPKAEWRNIPVGKAKRKKKKK